MGLAEFASGGNFKALEFLELRYNEIGDEGARHLANALEKGAAPALKRLDFRDNRISAAAEQEVRSQRPSLGGDRAAELMPVLTPRRQGTDRPVEADAESLPRPATAWETVSGRLRSFVASQTHVRKDDPNPDWLWEIPAEEESSGRHDRLDPW